MSCFHLMRLAPNSCHTQHSIAVDRSGISVLDILAPVLPNTTAPKRESATACIRTRITNMFEVRSKSPKPNLWNPSNSCARPWPCPSTRC